MEKEEVTEVANEIAEIVPALEKVLQGKRVESAVSSTAYVMANKSIEAWNLGGLGYVEKTILITKLVDSLANAIAEVRREIQDIVDKIEIAENN